MKAKDVEIGTTILDFDGNELIITETWPDQGEGLGVVLLGHNPEGLRKNCRYIDIDTEVEVVKSA